MADNSKDKVRRNGRIMYLEPNDILGYAGSKPVTPDYTDFCIGFNLTGEIVRRNRYDGYGGETVEGEKFTISWMGGKTDTDGNSVTFSGGSVVGDDDKRYLTTFYSDVDYRDFSRKEVIEGLGVESVTIQFANYYTPTIAIKFVDLRGASLFGRDEAIHENGKITADNVFGCFFTIPYPKFRLQIKGYYGREVTYQLYCSGFKGEFNSDNGNFEATATFLGYMYGILADIPMAYMMISPYCDYAGKKYWDDHSANDGTWRLYEYGIGFVGEPVRLIELRENIRDAIRGDREYFKNILTGLSKREIMDNTYRKSVAADFLKSFFVVINSLCSKYPSHNTVGGKTYFKMNAGTPDSKIESDIRVSGFDDYVTKLKDYCNGVGVTYETPSVSDFYVRQEIYDNNSRETSYYFCIETPKPVSDIRQNTEMDNESVTRMEEEVKRNNTITIKNLIRMYPYIGNVIKDSLFHLETFMHMMKTCIEEIKSEGDGRTFSKLGIPVDDTDANGFALNDGRVPPFVGVTKEEKAEEVSEGVDDDEANRDMQKNLGWLGDYVSDAPEVRMVNSIFAAMKDRSGGEEEGSTTVSDNERASLDRDIKVAIYMHLKNIYDRWVINEDFNDYRAAGYYRNFVFIDSFFRDIAYALHVNPETLGNALEACTSNDGRFLKFISTVASKEHCSIYGFPDTFMFTDNEKGYVPMDEGLVSAFRPIPFKDIGPMATSNRIVIVYAYKPSEIVNEDNGYRGDFFDVYSDGEVYSTTLPNQLKYTGYGYMIPSFGVAFGRQDNAIFKSLKISMENPVATEQSIKALSTLAMKAGASRSKVQYYGQDIYQVYSGYSYFCEFDMMGDVQIMPLMYFQLLNIPMFRGAYMIIDVSHTVRQGEMVTHVKGMRLSRNALPLTKSWFTPELVVTFDAHGNLENVDEVLKKFVSDDSMTEWFNGMYAENVREGIADYTLDQILEINDSTKETNRFAWLAGMSEAYMPEPDTAQAEKLFETYMVHHNIERGLLVGKQVFINKKLCESVERISEYLEQNASDEQKSSIKEGIVFGESSYRHVRNGSGSKSLSRHSIGAALDINGYTDDNEFQRLYGEYCKSIDKTLTDNDASSEGNNVAKDSGYYFNGVPGNPFWYRNGERGDTVLNNDWKDINSGNDPLNGSPKCIRNGEHIIVKAFVANGWGWGGSYGDTMHFSFFGGR